MIKPIFCAALLSSFIALPAYAGPELFIEDFVGTINVETVSASKISISQDKNMKGVNLYQEGDSLKIDGGIEKPDGNDCKGYYGSYSISWFKKENRGDLGGYKDLDDYPNLTVTAPKDTTLIIRNSIPFLTAGSLGSADLKLVSCGKVTLGDLSDGLIADIRGSGDLNVGDISGHADIHIRGSGDVDIGNGGDLRLKVTGSGDVRAGNVRSADIAVRGSGDVEIEDVNGPLGVESSGSSDVDIGDVSGDFVYDGRGSGDLSVSSVTGRVSVDIGRSGDADISGGMVSSLKVSASGASEFDFGGVAETADLYAAGASDIYIRKVTGEVRRKESGAADITID